MGTNDDAGACRQGHVGHDLRPSTLAERRTSVSFGFVLSYFFPVGCAVPFSYWRTVFSECSLEQPVVFVCRVCSTRTGKTLCWGLSAVGEQLPDVQPLWSFSLFPVRVRSVPWPAHSRAAEDAGGLPDVSVAGHGWGRSVPRAGSIQMEHAATPRTAICFFFARAAPSNLTCVRCSVRPRSARRAASRLARLSCNASCKH